MAKIESQSIPSEERIIYKRALQISTSHKNVTYVRTRYPWRIPQMQAGGADVKPAQKVQRDKFIYVKDKYNTLSAAEKARWAAANPEWNSYLFGYNFFMLEGLLGVGLTEYPQMIKSIQVVKQSMAAAGNTNFTITSVDPTKVVVLIAGNSYISDKVQRGSNTVNNNSSVNVALSPNVDPVISEVRLQGDIGAMELTDGTGDGNWGAPYVSALVAAQLTVAMANIRAGLSVTFSWEVIEHLAQTIYPVLVSIAATQITMAWAKQPSVAADVSITVVEYI